MIVITLLPIQTYGRLSNLRTLRLACVEISKEYSRATIIGRSVCWLWLTTPLLSPPIPKNVVWPLSLLAAITTGVTINAVLEIRYCRCWVSAIAATILYGIMFLLLAVPMTNPWSIVCGGISLSYVIAIALYIHYALKLVASTSHREEGVATPWTRTARTSRMCCR